MEKIRKHFYFSGRVQGVGFRYRSYYIAQSMGLTGWVKNLWDDRVEMEVQGDPNKINDLILYLQAQRFIQIEEMDEKKIHSIIDEAMAARDRSVSIYISPDGGVSVSVFPWPDEETLRNMRASGLISHNDYRTRLGLSPMKD